MSEGTKWHSMQTGALLRGLGTSSSGLSSQAAQQKLSESGPNSLAEAKKDPWYALLLAQFRSLPILMLLAASAISFGLGLAGGQPEKLVDAFAILVAVLLAVFFGFWQEYKAERALEALKSMVVQRSIVMRDGREAEIDSRDIVPGDVVVLEEGARVPADMRILEATNLSIDQSTLTGESRPSEKEARAVAQKAVLSERRNMLFAGTVIVRGHCRGVAVETGMRTEFGKIVGFVSESEGRDTPLQRNITELSKTLGYMGIISAVLFFAIGVLRGETAVQMFVVAVTLAVAVIPEGLPTVLAITLALGVQKMAKKNAIVRKMNAVETLGSATVICTDKTGTITQNRMTVQEIMLSERVYGIGAGLGRSALEHDSVFRRAIEIMSLCNNAMEVVSDGKAAMTGDPTEQALLVAAKACGADEKSLRASCRLEGEIPFDSDRKMMSTIRVFGRKRLALVKGAPEKVISRCTMIMLEKGAQKMAPEKKKQLLGESHLMAGNGMRMLALAYREIGAQRKYDSQNTEKSLVFVGLVSMEDPPRPEVKDAIALCHTAGIRVVMVTGDSLATAKAIASKVGLLLAGQRAVDGSELEGMNDAALGRLLPSVGVFARVTPEQKYRIVSAYMRRGEVVAVTGDGVNDSPAIKKADIGVAMGLSGTDVTKEVSDIVLTDDNFTSIVNAVKYGRTIFNNIKSFVRYQLSTNVAALSLMFSAPALSLPLPLLPIQILWINIMIDGPPALALGAELPPSDVMKKPPRNPKAGFISVNLLLSILVLGLVMASIALSLFSYYLSFAPEKAFTAVFTAFVFLQLLNALNCRSAGQSLFHRFLSNPYLFAAIIVSLALHMAIIYFPPLQEIFRTVPLNAADLLTIAASSMLVLLLEESKKKFLPHTTAY